MCTNSPRMDEEPEPKRQRVTESSDVERAVQSRADSTGRQTTDTSQRNREASVPVVEEPIPAINSANVQQQEGAVGQENQDATITTKPSDMGVKNGQEQCETTTSANVSTPPGKALKQSPIETTASETYTINAPPAATQNLTATNNGNPKELTKSNDENQGNPNEKRVPVKSACLSCRKSRVKCDKLLPCARCRRLGVACVPQLRGRGRPPSFRKVLSEPINASSPSKEKEVQQGVREQQQVQQGSLPIQQASIPALSQFSQFNMMPQQRNSFGAGSLLSSYLTNNMVVVNKSNILHSTNQPSIASLSVSPFFNSFKTVAVSNKSNFCIGMEYILKEWQDSQMPPGLFGSRPLVRNFLHLIHSIARHEQSTQLKMITDLLFIQAGMTPLPWFNITNQAPVYQTHVSPTLLDQVPPGYQMRRSWGSAPALYMERLISLGMSSYHCNHNWAVFNTKPGHGHNLFESRSDEADLLSSIIHPEDLQILFTKLGRVIRESIQADYVSLDGIQVRVFSKQYCRYLPSDVSMILYMSQQNGCIAHWCTKLEPVGIALPAQPEQQGTRQVVGSPFQTNSVIGQDRPAQFRSTSTGQQPSQFQGSPFLPSYPGPYQSPLDGVAHGGPGRTPCVSLPTSLQALMCPTDTVVPSAAQLITPDLLTIQQQAQQNNAHLSQKAVANTQQSSPIDNSTTINKVRIA